MICVYIEREREARTYLNLENRKGTSFVQALLARRDD